MFFCVIVLYRCCCFVSGPDFVHLLYCIVLWYCVIALYMYVCNIVFVNQVEMNLLQKSYKALARQMKIIFWKRLWYVQLEQFLMKYFWSAAGLIMVAIPVMSTTFKPDG